MKTCRRHTLLGLLAVLLAGPASGHAQPVELRDILRSAKLAGRFRATFLGQGLYEAQLWAEPGFKASEYDRHAFALELGYLRNFSNETISRRSLDEMKRQPGFPMAQLKSWQQFLRGAFPDVREGDRITGIHRPGAETMFVTNGIVTGTISDAEFGRFFFGIWLSSSTSEPGLRDALLAHVPS